MGSEKVNLVVKATMIREAIEYVIDLFNRVLAKSSRTYMLIMALAAYALLRSFYLFVFGDESSSKQKKAGIRPEDDKIST